MATTKHQRHLIRHAVLDRLLQATDAQDRVELMRISPHAHSNLPAIAIYATEEQVDSESAKSAPRELMRVLDLVVEVACSVSEQLDDQLDAISLQVERAMHKDPTLGELVADCILAGTKLGVDDSGRQPVGAAILTYRVTYQTFAPEAADVPLGDFATARVTHAPAGTTPTTPPAIDSVAVPTT
jgi:hypothetical protein